MKFQDYGKVPTERLAIDRAGKRWSIERNANLEALWEEMCADGVLDEDERLPYWAEIWPSSLLLCDWLARQKQLLAGARCLDIGCGLGLSALVGAWLGARVVGMDYEWPALYFAAKNSAINGLAQNGRAPCWLLGDWRRPALRPRIFQYIWGADILYERRFIEPVASLLEYALQPGGLVWFAAPERKLEGPFCDHLLRMGWKARKAVRQPVRPVTVPGPEVSITLWEFSKHI